MGRIQHLLGKRGILPETEYGEAVSFLVTVPAAEAEALRKEITEATNGKAVLTEQEKIYFVDKE